MKQLDEVKQNIGVCEMKCAKLHKKLDGLDPRSDEYKEVEERLKTMSEIKQNEINNFNRLRESRVPGWVTSLTATFSALGLGLFLYRGEAKGTVIGSTAVSMLNKFKFGK